MAVSTDPQANRTNALARVAAAIAIGGTTATLDPLANAARRAGATEDDLVAVLLTIAPIIGSARLVRAAPELARAIGYDIDRALEAP
jgi:alkylhydroperoxidase/carboxymuconolactone decarboxylase family protein YurZ